MTADAKINLVNNLTPNDHNGQSGSSNTSRGVEAFIYLFIFGGMFLALIGGATGLHYILKKNPTLLSDVTESIQKLDDTTVTTPKNHDYTTKEEVTEDNTVTDNNTETKVYINNNYKTNTQTQPSPSNPQPQATNPYVPPAATCYTYEIYSGELKSKRCYSYADYQLITDYHSKYQSADWSYDSANSSIDFLCEDDFFKDSCEDAKKRKDKAADDKEKYLELALAVIARGAPAK